MRVTTVSWVCAGIVAGFGASQAQAPEAVAYPEGYRHWTHVTSLVVGPENPNFAKFGGIHNVYANQKAIDGYRTGHFPDGTVFAEDMFDTTIIRGATVPTAKRLTAVMYKDSNRFTETGGWGFEVFGAGNPKKPTIGKNAKTECYQCHSSRKEQDFVFNSYRE